MNKVFSKSIIIKKLFVIPFCIFLFISATIATADAENETAVSLDLDISNSNGNSTSNIRDKSYDTKLEYAAGDSISITAKEDIGGVYLIWGYKPVSWTLSYGDTQKECGKAGYLHEYIAVSEDTKSVTVTFNDSAIICDIYVYSKGELPEDVQVWQAPCYNMADFLVFSTHADDEVLFLGGVLAQYGGQQGMNVQVVYMTNYWNGTRIREHEKLDGLWECGIRYYPVNMPFDDLYAESLEEAERVYSYDDLLTEVTKQIRSFHPMVVVTQDFNGEYGHGGHMILAKAVAEAVENSSDSSFQPESVQNYGTWDVPKAYFHLYPENTLTMNLRQPLSNMGDRTALEVASDAYLKHVSQQWCWFYVSDDYKYSCAEFGLYRTTVGADTGINDMFEHLTTHKEQNRLAEEEEAAKEYEDAIPALTQAANQPTPSPTTSPDTQKADAKENSGHAIWKTVIIVLIIVLILLVAGILIYTARLRKLKRRKQNSKRPNNRLNNNQDNYDF
ncbi:MAG: PIG-L deacetylase family protein [Lachnospiraceae bacterium]